ncbi:MAG: CoB--CoM heterodisulfide reductase iron-sulfur subunit A family protein [Anaerolineales bacterium]
MPENKVADKELRIGVYTCYCGGNISGVVNCDQVAEAMGKQANVICSRTDISMCSSVGQALIEKDIKELGVNRVIVGACAPALHEQTFRGAVTRAGLNPFLYNHVGLREQVSWAHPHDPVGATDKAMHLMSAGLAKARLLDPLEPIRLDAKKHALVIGGGVAGLRAALDLARQDLAVTLLEKSPFLGGRAAQLGRTFPNQDEATKLLSELTQAVVAQPSVTIYTQAEIIGVTGYVGNYVVQIRQHGRGLSDHQAEKLMAACKQEVSDPFDYGLTKRKVIYRQYEGCSPASAAVDWEHYDGAPLQVDGYSVQLNDEVREFELTVGAVVVATGFDPYTPRTGEYGYGELAEVATLPQLIRHLAIHKDGDGLEWNGNAVRSLALIHCVGSREIEGIDQPHADGQVNNYCSRVCCSASLQACGELHERFPKLNIYDLHQDIRTYGRGHEKLYYNALENGVRFLRFNGEERPTVQAASEGDPYPVLVRINDRLTYGEEIEIGVDLVILAVGMMPRDIDDLVKMLKVSRGSDRFLLEVHPKLRPVETAVNGIVLAGTVQGPMNIQESLLAASAAAAKVSSLLGKGRVELPPFVARVNAELCQGGKPACVESCIYEGAIAQRTFIENGKEVTRAVVTAANCTGCGACVAACPHGAIDIQGWTLGQYEAMVDAIALELPELQEAAK